MSKKSDVSYYLINRTQLASRSLLKNEQIEPILIYSQASYYPNLTKVFIPNSPFRKGDVQQKITIGYSQSETSLERSIRRTKKLVSDYVLCNNFDSFVTFTFKSNRQDIFEKRKQMATWLKNQRQRNGRFNYIVIPEYHKDKKSLHFHALFSGYSGTVVPAINSKTLSVIKHNGQTVFTLPSYTLGFNTLKKIKSNSTDILKVSNYVTKYITKELVSDFGKQRFWVSKGLTKPVIEDNPLDWFCYLRPDKIIFSEYGDILIFNSSLDSLLFQ